MCPEASEAADDRLVIAEFAIARHRAELADKPGNIIDRMRAFWMPRHLRLLPWREAAIEIGKAFGGLFFERLHFVGNRNRAARQRLQLGDLSFEFGDGCFEIKV